MRLEISLLAVSLAVSLAADAAADSAPYGEAPTEGQRVVLVTGSTGGLGREVARALAAEGDHVIVHGRSEERGRALVDELRATEGSARFYAADFGSLAEVRALAAAIRADYDRLDVLVNNAGIALDGERRLSEDGLELHFQVNYLAGFVLAEALLPMLRESDDGRLVNVSSGGQAPVDFDDLRLDADYSMWRAYSVSKHAQIMQVVDLAEDPRNASLRINALHPSAFMNTDMVVELGIEPESSVETGRDAVLRLIDGPDVGSGDFYDVFEKSRARFDQAYDAAARERLRTVSLELVEAGGGDAP